MEPSERETREQLARILASATFRSAKQMCDLLGFLTDAVLTGRADELKEYTLATEALGRNSSFDPRIDPIARVEASRLRTRLERYYATEGVADPVAITLPKGGYAPRIERRERPTQTTPVRQRTRVGWPWVAAAAIAVAAAAVLGWTLPRSQPAQSGELPVTRFETALGAPGELFSQTGSALAISRDGRSLAMLLLRPDGKSHLYVRPLASLEAVELPGTAGAYAPFFSPDGKWVAFTAGAKLKKTLADGSGSPVILADIADFLGGAWLASGDIILALNRRNMLWRLSENGGEAKPLSGSGGDELSIAAPRWGAPLPGERGMLFTSHVEDGYAIEFVKADGTGRKIVRRHGFYPRYALSGHLLYVDNGTLYAAKFDPDRAELVGEPWAVVKDVAFSEAFGSAHYDVSDTGTLVYWRQPGAGASVLSRVTPEGAAPLINQPARYGFPRLSPDGRKVAFVTGGVNASDLFIYDLSTHARVRVEAGTHALTFPLWRPDGRYLLNMDDTAGVPVFRRGDGSGPGGPLLSSISIPYSMTPDGKRLAYYKMGESTVFDLWTAPITEGPDGLVAGPEEMFRATPFVETYPAFSPDGRWIAYTSNEDGGFEVYIRAFPDRDGRVVKVSSSGGRVAAWSPTHIFYAGNDRRLMSAAWHVRDGRFATDEPKRWSPARLADTGVLPSFSLAADGKMLIGLTPAGGDEPADHITVVQNFFAELKRGWLP